jgi:hypothetical protein
LKFSVLLSPVAPTFAPPTLIMFAPESPVEISSFTLGGLKLETVEAPAFRGLPLLLGPAFSFFLPFSIIYKFF